MRDAPASATRRRISPPSSPVPFSAIASTSQFGAFGDAAHGQGDIEGSIRR